MKINDQSQAEYHGKVQLVFAKDNPQESALWQWLEDQRTAGRKLAPLIKEILWQYITSGQEKNGDKLDRILVELRNLAKTGVIVRGQGDEQTDEAADDVIAALGNIVT